MTNDKSNPKPLEKSRGEYQKHRVYTPDEIRSAIEWAEKNTIEKETCNKPRCVQCDVAKAVIEIYRQAFRSVLEEEK